MVWIARRYAFEITLDATDGTPVVVCPDFAVAYWENPGLWQQEVDAAAKESP
jgi:hypothetical protein